MRRAKTPFARCPCTQTAICAAAVNHPHHINCMNHSSDKYQPALVHARIPVNPSIRRKKATSPACARPAPRHGRPSPTSHLPCCAQNFSPNLSQSLAISRVSLVHLYVPFTFQSIGQRDKPYRLPAARTRLRFAQCPCTKTAICAGAGAVNHPHHINCMNHSSNKCQPSLIHALIPVNPSIPRKKASSPTRTRPPRPRARPSPTARLPSCAQKFLPNLTQSLAISRLTLPNLYVPLTLQSIGQRGDSYRLPAARIPLRFARCPCTKTAICAAAVNHPHHINHVNHSSNKCQRALIPVNPSIPRKKASSPTRTRPPRPRARPSPTARLPSCAQKFLPNLTQSLANSRLTLLHLHVPLTFQSIGQRGDSYRLPAARIPLRFARFSCTKPAIYAGAAAAAAVNHPHHINCVNHSSNKYQPFLIHALTPVNPSIRRTRRDTLPPSAKFFSESKETHEFTRQFAPLRATLILSARTDRIQSRASHEFMQRFDPLCACACAPPAATAAAAFTQPPVCRNDGAQPSNPTDSGN